MTRRSSAIVLGLLLVLMLVVAAVRSPVPFVALSPGLTVDVLARSGGKPVVEVQGHRTYPTEGALRLVTVSESTSQHEVGLLEALDAWWRPSVALLPRKIVYPRQTTDRDERAESAAQMVSSQDSAVAAALEQLGYDLRSVPVVSGITPGSPAEGKLEVRDELVSVAGTRTPDVEAVFDAVRRVEPGDDVVIEVRRDGKPRRVTLTTVASPEDPDRAMVGIFPATSYRFPFDVSVGIDEQIGGPSAGLLFALAIYDVLTPGSLTGGQSVAATGTIDANGRVGGIGGVRQKVVGAQRDGATMFLVPPDNCEDAMRAPVDDGDIAVVPAPTLEAAIEAVKTHADDPNAELPRCTDES